MPPGGIKGTGKLKVSGPLLYEPNKYEFFLKEPVLNCIVIVKVPDKYMPKIKHGTTNDFKSVAR